MKDKLTNEKIDPNTDTYYEDRFGDFYNEGSYEYMWENPSTIFEIGPNGVITLKFNNSFGMMDMDEDGEMSLKMPEPIKEEKWANTGGYHGHTDWVLNNGFVKYSEGWVTGYPDETTKRKAELSELYDDLRTGKLVPPVTIWWVFGVTSNIFSTSSSIIIKKKNMKKLNKWLESIGHSKESIDHQMP